MWENTQMCMLRIIPHIWTKFSTFKLYWRKKNMHRWKSNRYVWSIYLLCVKDEGKPCLTVELHKPIGFASKSYNVWLWKHSNGFIVHMNHTISSGSWIQIHLPQFYQAQMSRFYWCSQYLGRYLDISKFFEITT